MLDASQIRAYVPVINWDMPPAFPGEAMPEQPVKLPRHSKVLQVRFLVFEAVEVPLTFAPKIPEVCSARLLVFLGGSINSL
jgi:hypothetical protein